MARRPRGIGNKTVEDVIRYVSLGHSQSASNCRILIAELQRLREENNRLRSSNSSKDSEVIEQIKELISRS